MKLEGTALDDAISRALTRSASGLVKMRAYACSACDGTGITHEFARWPDGTTADSRQVACGYCLGFGFTTDGNDED